MKTSSATSEGIKRNNKLQFFFTNWQRKITLEFFNWLLLFLLEESPFTDERIVDIVSRHCEKAITEVHLLLTNTAIPSRYESKTKELND